MLGTEILLSGKIVYRVTRCWLLMWHAEHAGCAGCVFAGSSWGNKWDGTPLKVVLFVSAMALVKGLKIVQLLPGIWCQAALGLGWDGEALRPLSSQPRGLSRTRNW